MINNTNNTQKIFGNIFDNMSVQQFLDIDRIPRGTDDATMIRVNNGIKGYLGLDAKMPTNILVSEALLFLEIHNNPDKYPEIWETISKGENNSEIVDKMSPDELFDYMKNKGIISADSQKDMPLAPIGEDYSKEELDKLLKEADEIFQ